MQLRPIFVRNEGKAMRCIVFMLFFCCSSFLVSGQQLSEMEAVMRLEGAASAEDMDPYEVERFENLLRNPLRINLVSSSKIEESGLLSHYQAVSLADYRSRHGDVLSFNELAAVDGFGMDFVARIAPFISLESRSLPGSVQVAGRTSHELVARNSLKIEEDGRKRSLAYGIRYRLDAAGRLGAGLAFSKSYDQEGLGIEDICGNIRLDFRRVAGKVIVGDFNARFGQGLALWNGMGLGGMMAPSAFMKRSSGLGASSSFSGSYAMRGVAADLTVGHARFSSSASVRRSEKGLEILPAFNATWYWKSGSAGLTHYADLQSAYPRPAVKDMKTSMDFSLCHDGVDVFGECAYDWVNSSVAALAGLVLPAGDDVRLAAMLRYYPASYVPSRSAAARSLTKCTNEHSVSVAAEAGSGKWVQVRGKEGFGSSVRRHGLILSADAAYLPQPKKDDHLHDMQLKANAEWTVMAASSLRVKMRLSEKMRSWGRRFRTEARADISYISGPWMMTLRSDVVRSVKTGFLSYLESSYKTDKTALHLRLGAFCIDQWDDRIYAYERDAPGSFNVPAYYGRGVWTALTGSWKFARCGRMYYRAGHVSYPFMEKKKPGKAELKIQFIFDI